MFSTPENLLVEISEALGMKESHFLSKNVFWENTVGYLRIGECQSFQACAIVFSTHGNLLVEISEALGMKESHFLSKNVYTENLLVEISGALGKKESHLLSKNVFWENTVGYLRNGEY